MKKLILILSIFYSFSVNAQGNQDLLVANYIVDMYDYDYMYEVSQNLMIADLGDMLVGVANMKVDDGSSDFQVFFFGKKGSDRWDITMSIMGRRFVNIENFMNDVRLNVFNRDPRVFSLNAHQKIGKGEDFHMIGNYILITTNARALSVFLPFDMRLNSEDYTNLITEYSARMPEISKALEAEFGYVFFNL